MSAPETARRYADCDPGTKKMETYSIRARFDIFTNNKEYREEAAKNSSPLRK
jgi:hypothetical protein